MCVKIRAIIPNVNTHDSISMKPVRSLLIVACALPILSSTSGYSWSAPGHQAIAQAAMQMLKGTPTEAKVNAILDGESVADAAIWLDRVREHFKFDNPSDDDEAAVFRQDFPGNENWHFCNYIVGSTTYDFSSKFSSNDDVVHALERAIAVLEGSASKMTKQQALRSVFHLVGDIHQPLHCITGYYDLSDLNHPVLLKDVEDPKAAAEDRGGNQLYYTRSQELHALWDLGLPRRISTNINTLALKLIVTTAGSSMITEGDFHHWPEIWAGDSMKQANAAYAGITFDLAAFVPNPRHAGQQMLKISVSLPAGEKGYKESQQPTVQDQLTKAAVHLTQLLSKINFK